jgi:hypothetical protein
MNNLASLPVAMPQAIELRPFGAGRDFSSTHLPLTKVVSAVMSQVKMQLDLRQQVEEQQ